MFHRLHINNPPRVGKIFLKLKHTHSHGRYLFLSFYFVTFQPTCGITRENIRRSILDTGGSSVRRLSSACHFQKYLIATVLQKKTSPSNNYSGLKIYIYSYDYKWITAYETHLFLFYFIIIFFLVPFSRVLRYDLEKNKLTFAICRQVSAVSIISDETKEGLYLK